MSRVVWIAIGAWVAGALLAWLVAASHDADGAARSGGAETEHTEAAEPAPDFALAQLGGGEVRLSALRGKTVILDFWATWCAPCEFQVPELNAFFDAHRSDSDVIVYGISVDTKGPEVVQRWVTDKAVRYPILLEGEDVARKLGAIGFPSLFIVAPDGTVHSEHVGLVDSEALETALSELRATRNATTAGRRAWGSVLAGG